MEKFNILLIDDDFEIYNFFNACVNSLSNLLYAADYDEGKKLFLSNDIQLLIVDYKLKNQSGINLIQELSEQKKVNTLLITSSHEIGVQVEAHRLGVHDYISKPLNIDITRAILEKNINRIMDKPVSIITKGPIFLDLMKHEAFIKEEGLTKKIELTPIEYDILKLLMKKSGFIYSRSMIFNKIWDTNQEVDSRTVDMHISSLRRKFGKFSHFIKTKRSVGYFFEAA